VWRFTYKFVPAACFLLRSRCAGIFVLYYLIIL